MIGILASLQLCDQESTLRTFKIVYIVLNIIKIIVPIIIIIIGTKDMMNVALTGKDEEMKLATKQLIKRIIAGLIVFLLPTIIDTVFRISASYEKTPSEFSSCSVCLTNGKECDTLMAMARQRKELEEEKQKEKYADRYILSEEDLALYEKRLKEYMSREHKPRIEPTETDHSVKTKIDDTVAVTKYFNSNDVTKISGLSEQELIAILSKTSAYKGKARMYIPYAKDLIAAEKNHRVNAFYLIGVYSLESGWLGSNLAKECNNIGGVKFYKPYQLSNGKYTRNCRNGWAGFDSKSDFIDYHASLLERAYLTPGASHYHGTSVAAVATDYGHGNGVGAIIQIAAKVSSQ